jgi:hypothetical protein
MTWMIEAFQHLMDSTTTYGDRLFLGAVAIAWLGAIAAYAGTRRVKTSDLFKGSDR